MKNKIKLILSAAMIMVFVAAFNFANAQAPVCVVNYNGTGLTPGSTVYVPITLTGTTVGSFQLLLSYDRDVLTYVGQTNTVSGYGFFSVFDPFTHVALPGQTFTKLQLAYSAGSPGATYNNQTIATLQFTFNGGSTNITFANIATTTGNNGAQFTFIKANPYTLINLASTFTGGTAAGSYATLTSVSGGGDFEASATWVENKVPTNACDVTITGNVVTDNGATGRCHNLTINAAGQMTVATGKSLTVSGNMLIKSDVTGSGSFIDLGTTTITGTSTVQRYMTGNWNGTWPPTNNTDITWHYVSSPVSGGTINSFLGGLLNYWNEPANTWSPMTLPVTTPLVVNQGYSAAMTSNGVITFTGGTLNTGTQNISGLTNTNATSARGFNLIGNAFPSAVKWDASVALSNVDGAAYLWNGTSYVSYLQADGYQIPAEQGFYVHVTTGFNSGFIVIPNTNRVHSANAYVKSTGTENLNLSIAGNNLEDATSIRFNADATEGFDSQYDAYKIWGITECPQVYSIIPSDNLSINSLPELTTQTVIPVGIRVGKTDTYSITASNLESFPSGTDVYLEDILLNKTQNLNLNPVYSFSASSGSPVHRFDIHFAPTTGIGDINGSNLKIYSSYNNVFVNIPMDLHGTILVYDLLGKEITSKQIEGNTLNKISMDAPQGYYLVKVLGDKATVTGKVFIN